MIGIWMFFWGCAAQKSQHVVPQAEFVEPKKSDSQTPQETKGITSVDALGFINLQEEFSDLDTPLFFRLRRLEIAPGGSVAIHEHDQRPGVAYILSGSITEYRQDGEYIRNAGDHAFEYTGIRHGWKIHTEEPVQALVADVLKPKDTPEIAALPEQKQFADAPSTSQDLSLLKKSMSSLTKEGGVFANKNLRIRVVSLAPNGVVVGHKHESRPGFAYVLSGSVLQHRGDADYQHQSGSAVVERNGLSHWWVNTGDVDTKLVVFDIVTQEE